MHEILLPHDAERQIFYFFAQREHVGKVAVLLHLFELVMRGKQRRKQRLLNGAGANDPRGYAVDAGVEKVQPYKRFT